MRPDEREFLSQVLENLEDLPQGLRERLLKLVGDPPEAGEDRSDVIRRLLEEHSRD
jgi:hypothetical protein